MLTNIDTNILTWEVSDADCPRLATYVTSLQLRNCYVLSPILSLTNNLIVTMVLQWAWLRCICHDLHGCSRTYWSHDVLQVERYPDIARQVFGGHPAGKNTDLPHDPPMIASLTYLLCLSQLDVQPSCTLFIPFIVWSTLTWSTCVPFTDCSSASQDICICLPWWITCVLVIMLWYIYIGVVNCVNNCMQGYSVQTVV